MSYLLHIVVSPMGENSKSRAVGDAFVDAFKASHEGVEVKTLDLDADKPPHLDTEALYAGYTPEEQRSEGMKAKHQKRLDYIKELTEAKAVTISTPMYNWSAPSVLKAYIDQIVMPGVLDPYNFKLMADKPMTFIIASGGSYSEGSWHPEWDYLSGYLKMLFTNLGATDVTVIRAEYTLAGVVPGMESLVEKEEESFAKAKVDAEERAKSILA